MDIGAEQANRRYAGGRRRLGAVDWRGRRRRDVHGGGEILPEMADRHLDRDQGRSHDRQEQVGPHVTEHHLLARPLLGMRFNCLTPTSQQRLRPQLEPAAMAEPHSHMNATSKQMKTN